MVLSQDSNSENSQLKYLLSLNSDMGEKRSSYKGMPPGSLCLWRDQERYYWILQEHTERCKSTLGKIHCGCKNEAIAAGLFAEQQNLKWGFKSILLYLKELFVIKCFIDDIACEVASSETINLDRNPESVNRLDERRLLWGAWVAQ